MKKIPTIFKRDGNNMKNILPEQNDACAWVFEGQGVATRKYDGTCCLIKDGLLYKRQEIKNADNLPLNFIRVDYDPATNKVFGWLPVDSMNPGDKWHIDALLLAANDVLCDGTYELLGPKIQGNPEKYLKHTLLKHSDAEVFNDVPRDFNGLKQWLSDKDIEGIVFHHPDGRMAKIKKRDFGLKR